MASDRPRVLFACGRSLASTKLRLVKTLALRRADSCAECGAALPVGTQASWDSVSRTVRCLTCSNESSAHIADEASKPRTPEASALPEQRATALAGGSAQREYARRSQNREQRVLEAHPKLGRLLLAVFNEPSSTRVWAQGAAGERAVAAKLDALAGAHVVALHDRRMLREDGRPSRANLDHLVVAATGVWVVDAKTHHGTLEVRRAGGLFSPRVEKLYIGGRDKTALLTGLATQVEAVRRVLQSVDADVPVRGALCFVGTELPWFGESIAGVPLVGRRGLAKLMKQTGSLDADARDAIAAFLSARFVPA